MVTITNLKELNNCKLTIGDAIVFRVNQNKYLYYVSDRHLTGGNCANEEIFSVLDITNKYQFATDAYGYHTEDGRFPVCKENDIGALKRIGVMLYLKINSHVVKAKLFAK